MNRLLMLLLIAGLVAGSMAEFNFSRELGKKDDGDYSGKKEKNNDYDDKKKKQNAKKYDDDYGKKGQKEKGDVMVANNNYDEKKKQNAKKYDDDQGKKGKKEKGGVMVAKIDTDNNKGGVGIPTFPAPPTTDTPTSTMSSSMPTLSPVNNIPTVTPLRPDFVVTAELFDLVVASSTDNGAAVRTVGSPQQQKPMSGWNPMSKPPAIDACDNKNKNKNKNTAILGIQAHLLPRVTCWLICIPFETCNGTVS